MISNDQITKRYDACKSCTNFNNVVKVCKICMCFMPAKIRLERATCPVGLWGNSKWGA